MTENTRFEQKIANHEYAKGAARAWRQKALSVARQKSEIVSAARDLVALWEDQNIRGLPRAERNKAIDGTRERLISAVKEWEEARLRSEGDTK